MATWLFCSGLEPTVAQSSNNPNDPRVRRISRSETRTASASEQTTVCKPSRACLFYSIYCRPLYICQVARFSVAYICIHIYILEYYTGARADAWITPALFPIKRARTSCPTPYLLSAQVLVGKLICCTCKSKNTRTEYTFM